MAELRVVSLANLDAGVVLAPERYDPRRQLPWPGPAVGSLAAMVTTTIRQWQGPAFVLDTSHVHEGMVRPGPLQPQPTLGSARRQLLPGDVVISRLRPYLRQVAWVDPGLVADHPGAALLASPELVVFRPTNGCSLAFLVPLLLSIPVQRALTAAQEGSHHPRVPRQFLTSIPVPAPWLAHRDRHSRAVEEAIQSARESAAALQSLATLCGADAD